MRILGIAGSLRPGSYNARLLRAAAAAAPDGVEVVVYDELAGVPPFDLDREGDGDTPSRAAAFQAAIAATDGLLVATPEYNGSIPGQLKNALDWASVPFPDNVLRNKPAAVIGTSTGMFGAVWAQADVRKVLGLSGARVLDRDTPVPLAEMAFTEDGALADPEIAATVARTVADLADMVGARAAA